MDVSVVLLFGVAFTSIQTDTKSGVLRVHLLSR